MGLSFVCLLENSECINWKLEICFWCLKLGRSVEASSVLIYDVTLKMIGLESEVICVRFVIAVELKRLDELSPW